MSRIFDWISTTTGRWSGKSSPGERRLSGFVPWGTIPGQPGLWGDDETRQIAAFTGWVYIAIRAIADQIAGAQLKVAFRRTPEQAKKALRRGKSARYVPKEFRRRAMTNLQSHEELEGVDSDHRLVRLLADPNPPDTYATFMTRLIYFLELRGVAYVWMVPSKGLGLPCELWVLPSHWVKRGRDPEKGNIVDWYRVQPLGNPGIAYRTEPFFIPASEVFEVACPNPWHPFDGLSPTLAGAGFIDVDRQILRSQFASFVEAIYPSIILGLDKEMNDPDEATISRLKTRVEEHYQGPSKRGRPLILAPGMSVIGESRSPVEMDYSSGMDLSRDRVMALYRVSKTIAGLTENVNRASMDAAQANFATYTIGPKMRLISGIFTERLAHRFDPDLLCYYDNPTTNDPEQINRDIKTDASCMAITPNEIRALRGREPFDGFGDDPRDASGSGGNSGGSEGQVSSFSNEALDQLMQQLGAKQ